MNGELKSAFEAEIAAAGQHIRAGRLDRGMRHLETAHVLEQNYVLPHIRTHWLMLRIACKRHALVDICGQALRIVLGAFGSAVGNVPRGNTGGSNVNMFNSMPIDPVIAALIERDRFTKWQSIDVCFLAESGQPFEPSSPAKRNKQKIVVRLKAKPAESLSNAPDSRPGRPAVPVEPFSS